MSFGTLQRIYELAMLHEGERPVDFECEAPPDILAGAADHCRIEPRRDRTACPWRDAASAYAATGVEMTLRRTLLVASLLLSTGCVHMFPPPPTPGPVQPPRWDAPIPPGQGRVYIDVVDGPTNMRVVNAVSVQVPRSREEAEIFGAGVDEETVLETKASCRSPCVLDLPLGYQLFAFPMHGSPREEVERVSISPTPSLYRRSLGSRRSGGAGSVLGILGATFGGISLTTGAALLPVGLATDKSGLTISGAITLGVGAVLTALGIWAIAENPALEQPGASAQYDLTP